MARVLVPLAPGFEEIEAITIIDVLRRADVEVVAAGIDLSDEQTGRVTGSHGITVQTDAYLDDVIDEAFDIIALPGGLPGADHLQAHEGLRSRLQFQASQGGQIAAICAAPKVLAAADLLQGRSVTSYPGFISPEQYDYKEDPVVVDGNMTTSRGPSTALRFALQLVEQLAGVDKRRELEEKMLVSKHGS